MSLSSMTGYARAAGQEPDTSWVWEVRSVNGKSLDLRVRVPSGWEWLDPEARSRGQKRFNRGSFVMSLDVRRSPGAQSMQVNTDLLEELIRQCSGGVPGTADEPPRLDVLLTVRGVVEPVDEKTAGQEDDALRAAVIATLDEALEGLRAARGEEGARLQTLLTEQVTAIEALCKQAADLAAAQPDALRERVRTQVEMLIEASATFDEARLTQEAALLAAKADVREEIDRLLAHVAAARDLLGKGGVVGRKLEFLSQEFNREANTLCSKSADIELTRVGLALKAAIDQFREQVQNIE